MSIERSSGPVRTCVGCRTARPVNELRRTIRRDDGSVAIDRAGFGRGAWLCRSVECFDLAVRRKAFNRAFRAEVNAASLAKLRVSW